MMAIDNRSTLLYIIMLQYPVTDDQQSDDQLLMISNKTTL